MFISVTFDKLLLEIFYLLMGWISTRKGFESLWLVEEFCEINGNNLGRRKKCAWMCYIFVIFCSNLRDIRKVAYSTGFCTIQRRRLCVLCHIKWVFFSALIFCLLAFFPLVRSLFFFFFFSTAWWKVCVVFS